MTETIRFEVYRDETTTDEPDVFAVLTRPGPDVPRGTLAAVQDAVENSDAFADLENGAGVENAGEVEYQPGADDGEVLDVTIHADVDDPLPGIPSTADGIVQDAFGDEA